MKLKKLLLKDYMILLDVEVEEKIVDNNKINFFLKFRLSKNFILKE